MPRTILLGMLVCLAACTAPQGKKIGMNDGSLAPVATGPTEKLSTVTYEDREKTIGLAPSKTFTVKLPAMNREGSEWRLSEIPDPSVLKLVSNDYTPNQDPFKPGEQTMVFEGTGVGEVDVKMWYGTLWASPMDSIHTFNFIASVAPEDSKGKAKSKKSKKYTAKTVKA
jgi:hypothetical protein